VGAALVAEALRPFRNVLFRVSGFRVSGFGFRVSGFGFRVSVFRFRADLESKNGKDVHGRKGRPRNHLVQGSGFSVSGFGFRISDFGFRFSGFGFRVSSFGYDLHDARALFCVDQLWFRGLGSGFRVRHGYMFRVRNG